MRYTLLALLAACGSSPSAPPVANAGSGTGAAPPTSVDCGVVSPATPTADAQAAYHCLSDAFDARTPASLRTEFVSDEGGHTYVTYTVGDDLQVEVDDRDDGFAADPGIHVSHCSGLHLEPTADSAVIYPDDCR